jgi:hypothetical protein
MTQEQILEAMRHLPRQPREWVGRRRMAFCMTVPHPPSGRRARKAAFAARARWLRGWMARYKRDCLATGHYFEVTR